MEGIEQELPNHWKRITLNDVAIWSSGGTPLKSNSDYYGGNIPWLIINDLNDASVINARRYISKLGLERSSAKWVPIDSVMVAMYGSIGKLGINKVRCTTNQAIAFTKEIFRSVYNKYLFYYLLFSRSSLHLQGKGGTQKNISLTVLKKFPIPLPPLNEQKRIVNKIEELLSELDHAVESFKKIQQQLKIYRQAVLKAAFEGKLTEGWRKNNQVEKKCLLKTVFNVHEITDVFDFSENFESQLPPIPSSWEWVYLKRLGELARGKSKHRPRNDSKLFGGEYPFVQTGEIKAANPYLKSFHQTYSEIGLSQSRLWDRGTLCITIAANIAETAILDIKACFPDSIVGFTSDLNKVLTKYILYFIQASKAKIQAYAPATAQKNINLATLQGLVIPYCSLEEQSQIVQEIESRLSICDELEKTIEQNLILEKSLRQSILKKAFEGKLVPQDPNDEPAELLLEKIKLEKEKLAKLTNSSKTKTKREKVTA